MKLKLKHSETVFELPNGGNLLIGNDDDCQVQINRPEIWGRHAEIQSMPYGLILKVYSSPLIVNGFNINDRCMIYPGDEITVVDLVLLVVNENYIPKSVNENIPLQHNESREDISSVFGLRRLSGSHSGQFIKADYQHHSCWEVKRSDAKLALLAHQKEVLVNGQEVDKTWLNNGDRIRYGESLFSVECPGHSGYSKFSPSHPRNVQLSESVTGIQAEESKNKSVSHHYWWLTLLIGLVILFIVILTV